MAFVASIKYQLLLEHFKGTKAMIRGIEAMAFVASMQYQLLLEHFKGTKAMIRGH